MQDCTNCSHKDICKYRDIARDLKIELINLINSKINKKDIFKNEFKCSFYSESKYLAKENSASY